MTYIAHYLEETQGLTFQRTFRDDNLDANEDYAIDQIQREMEEEGAIVLAITHNGFTVWEAQGIEG